LYHPDIFYMHTHTNKNLFNTYIKARLS